MIEKHQTANSVVFQVCPFSKPSRNAACRIMAEVKSVRGTRRDARIIVSDLNNVMTISDVSILVNALRAMSAEVQAEMDQVQKRVQQRVARSKK